LKPHLVTVELQMKRISGFVRASWGWVAKQYEHCLIDSGFDLQLSVTADIGVDAPEHEMPPKKKPPKI
jgi:hypothetical protein